MIGKITRGQRAYGLLRYLLRPGNHEEHIDAHVIAAWDNRSWRCAMGKRSFATETASSSRARCWSSALAL